MPPPIFAATITPNNALSSRGFRVLMVIFALLASIPAVTFYLLGAWPVVGLMGLDVLALWFALRLSMRASAAREMVTLWPDLLEIRNVAPGGKERLVTLQPFFVRLTEGRDASGRLQRLAVRALDREEEVARFLAPDQKADFARALSSALRQAR